MTTRGSFNPYSFFINVCSKAFQFTETPFLCNFARNLVFMKLIQELNKHIKVDAEIERFLNEECETKVFEKGEILSKQNQYNHTVFFVDEGLLRMFYYENGKDITTNFYSEGKITANIDTLFKNQPTRNNRYILGNLMIEMSRRISSLQFMTAKEKYIQLLEENPNIILRAPLGMIASYLGISQETLSRIRSDI